jgi:hypothetical protein
LAFAWFAGCATSVAQVDVVSISDSTRVLILEDGTTGVVFLLPSPYPDMPDSIGTDQSVRMMIHAGLGRKAKFRVPSTDEIVQLERDIRHWWNACRLEFQTCPIAAPETRRLVDYARQYIGYTDSTGGDRVMVVAIHRDIEAQVDYWMKEPAILSSTSDEYLIFDYTADPGIVMLRYGIRKW